MKGIEKEGYYYDPPNWKKCPECNGKGFVWVNHYKTIQDDCKNCNGTGRLPIYYTIEQWEEAGGILTDDTACWQIIEQDSQTLYFMEPWGDLKTLREGTIVISAIRPDELQNK